MLHNMLSIVLYWWSYISAVGSVSLEPLICETNLSMKCEEFRFSFFLLGTIIPIVILLSNILSKSKSEKVQITL